MNNDLRKHILNLLSASNPMRHNPEVILRGWETYFSCHNICPDNQEREFHRVLHEYLMAGSLDVSAPEVA